MTLEELKDFNEHITALRKYAEALIAEQSQQPEQPKLERWKPELGQVYWHISWYGDIGKLEWYGSKVDCEAWGNFNCFPNQEEAEKEVLRTRARRKLEWLARELNAKAALTPDGFIIYPCKGKVVISGCTLSALQLGAVFFYNKTDAEYALSQMTAEELEALR